MADEQSNLEACSTQLSMLASLAGVTAVRAALETGLLRQIRAGRRFVGAHGELLNGALALAHFQLAQQDSTAEPPSDLVYKQVKKPADELTYYELVSAAEVLRGARIDVSDLDRAVVTLLPQHMEQLMRIQAIALAFDDNE